MGFHEIRFPTSLSMGSLGGPERRTEIVTLANGYEERNSPWKHSRRRYDAGLGLRSLDDVATVVAFFEARHGPLNGFRWKDWADYKSGLPSAEISGDDQLIGQGDQETATFQLVKTYRSGEHVYLRPIHKPVLGSVRLTVSGEPLQDQVDYVVDVQTGVVTFAHPPDDKAEIFAGYEFDVPVRFDTDMIRTSVSSFQAGEVPDIPVVELRQ